MTRIFIQQLCVCVCVCVCVSVDLCRRHSVWCWGEEGNYK